jgi:hypothetical protein
MMARLATLAALPVLLGADDPGAGVGKASAAPASFPVAAVHFERNVTDGDIEVVFEVKGRDQGLAKLVVAAPDGRTVIDFTAPDASTMGIRQFRFESPEPGDVASLKTAYPEGVYTFTGATAAGEKLHGQSRLSHRLPASAAFLRPAAGARGVGLVGLVLTWTPVTDVAAYVVYIEQPALDFSLTARLPASVTRFAVPDGVLAAGRAYQVGIGTVTAQGNSSFVETTVTTAGKP